MTDLPETRVIVHEGRELAWCEYGLPGGTPLFQLHGIPGSRFQRYFDGDAYVRHGFRVIVMDRPGYGRSTRRHGRLMTDTSGDIGAIAGALGIDRFALLGWSGGGSFVLSAAAHFGRRVLGCASLVPVAPFDADFDVRAGMDEETLEGLRALAAGERAVERYYEELAARWTESLARGELPFPAPPPAVPVAKQWMPAAFAQGVGGAVDDDLALGRGWGSDLASIECPTAFWAATDDTVCPFTHATWLSRIVPGATLHPMTGGHLSFLPNMNRILAHLREAVSPAT